MSISSTNEIKTITKKVKTEISIYHISLTYILMNNGGMHDCFIKVYEVNNEKSGAKTLVAQDYIGKKLFPGLYSEDLDLNNFKEKLDKEINSIVNALDRKKVNIEAIIKELENY